MKAFGIAVTLALVAIPAMAATCPPPERAVVEVPEAMRSMYVALKTDDLKAFQAVTTPDFYSYDVGKRFDGDALALLVKAAHAKGNVYEWSVTEPHVEVDCRMAFVTYVNIGSVTDASGRRPVTWLESAMLNHDGTHWRIRFFHSTRMQMTP